jgi:hypothetical protein
VDVFDIVVTHVLLLWECVGRIWPGVEPTISSWSSC